MSGQTSERSRARERSEQGGARKRVSGASERMSEWPSTYVWILGYSGPLYMLHLKDEDVDIAQIIDEAKELTDVISHRVAR